MNAHTTSPIIVQLLGGLGNQMFQYAAGLAVANGQPARVLADVSILHDHSAGRHPVNRTFGLDIFSVYPRFATTCERFLYNSHQCPLPLKLASRLMRLSGRRSPITHRAFRFDHSLLAPSPHRQYLSGLWQSHKHLTQYKTTICSCFRFKAPLPPQYHDLANELTNPDSVCLNVRRGDFVSHKSTAEQIGFVGVDYYRTATNYLEKQRNRPLRYFVFSDEPGWCCENLNWLGANTYFVNHEMAGTRFEHYMHLMTHAHSFIIPNSTFAWWAAWLSSNSSKTVIAPMHWFSDQTLDASDLCPDSWIRI